MLSSPHKYIAMRLHFSLMKQEQTMGNPFRNTISLRKRKGKKISPCKEDLTIKPSYLMAGKGCGDTDVRI